MIPAVFTYTRKPAATFFGKNFAQPSDGGYHQGGRSDGGAASCEVVPTSQYKASCTERGASLSDCSTGKDLYDRAIFPHDIDALVLLCISKIPTSAPRPFKRGSCL